MLTTWSVIAGEQPSATKWNYIGDNFNLLDDYATSGWVPSEDTWTYATASTFTIAGVDRTSVYQKGTKLRWKQGGAYKYGNVASSTFSTNTTVTIIVNTDYTIANSAITDNGYSYSEIAQGFPDTFVYTPTWITSGTQPAIGNGTLTGQYTVSGRTITATVYITMGSTTTFGTGEHAYGTPTTVLNANLVYLGSAYALDSGTAHFGGITRGTPNSADFHVFNSASASAGWDATRPFTWTTSDQFRGQLTYTF